MIQLFPKDTIYYFKDLGTETLTYDLYEDDGTNGCMTESTPEEL